MHMMFASVSAFFFRKREGLGAQSVLCACCGFRECPMMMQIRLPLLNGLLGVFGGLLADLLCCLPAEDLLDSPRSWEDGRCSTMPSSAERTSAPMRLDGHHRLLVIIGSDLDDVQSERCCVFFLDVVRLIWVEVFLFRSCDERQTC